MFLEIVGMTLGASQRLCEFFDTIGIRYASSDDKGNLCISNPIDMDIEYKGDEYDQYIVFYRAGSKVEKFALNMNECIEIRIR